MRKSILFPLVPFPVDFDKLSKPQDIPFIIQDFLPLGYLAILASFPKQGKTSFATALALAVASGTPFAGMSTTQTPVLWLSLEESPTERAILLSQVPEELKQKVSPSDPTNPQPPTANHLPPSDTANR